MCSYMIPLWQGGLRCHLGMNPGLLGLQHTTCCWKCSCLGTSWESLCTEIMCSNNYIFIEVNTTYYLCICHCVDWNLLKDRWLRSSLLKCSPSRNCGLVINFIKFLLLKRTNVQLIFLKPGARDENQKGGIGQVYRYFLAFYYYVLCNIYETCI